MSLNELLETKYFRANLRIRDEKTREQYRFAMFNFDRFLGHSATLDDLTDDNVAGLMLDLENRGLAVRTINERRGRICAFWKWLAARKYLDRWPTVVNLPQPERDPVAWRRDELARLIRAASTQRGSKYGIPLRDWWLALLLVCWDTGVRTSELLSLRWEWLDFESGICRVPAVARKGKRKPATYWLKEGTLAVLGRFRKDSGLIFQTATSPSSFYNRWRKLLKKAGLPVGRSEGPQKLRRSYATWIAASGGDATAALQHSSAAITRRSYLDRSICETPQNRVLFSIAQE